MMERSPTWKIWRLLHHSPSLEMYEMMVRMLRVKYPATGRASLNYIWVWVVMNLLINIVAVGVVGSLLGTSFGALYFLGFEVTEFNFILPTLITFVSLRYALRVTSAITKQHELGNYDLFATLPSGAIAHVFNIARTYRHPLQGVLYGVWSALAVFLLSAFYILSLFTGVRYGSNSASDVTSFLFLIMMVTRGMAAFIDYLQSFVAAFLLGVMTSVSERRGNAQLWLVGYFLSLQFAFYVMNVLLSLLGTALLFAAGFQNIFFFYLILVQPLIFIAIRELINFALWQAVKRRLEAE